MRDRGASPAVRPGSIVEVESRVALIIVKGAIDRERTGLRIESQHEQTIFIIPPCQAICRL